VSKRTGTGTLVRLGGAAAVAGGLLWVIKFTVIALRDDSFEPLESVVFVCGLVGIILGTVALATLVARRESPWLALLVVVGAALASFLLQIGVQALVNAAADADNLGISEEVGVLFVGALWLAVGLALTRRSPPQPI
jgi:drug/metabolite transporter (DMT)-like permease